MRRRLLFSKFDHIVVTSGGVPVTDALTINVGESITLGVVGVYRNGSTVVIANSGCLWTSASVDNVSVGRTTGVATGEAFSNDPISITCTYVKKGKVYTASAGICVQQSITKYFVSANEDINVACSVTTAVCGYKLYKNVYVNDTLRSTTASSDSVTVKYAFTEGSTANGTMTSTSMAMPISDNRHQLTTKHYTVGFSIDDPSVVVETVNFGSIAVRTSQAILQAADAENTAATTTTFSNFAITQVPSSLVFSSTGETQTVVIKTSEDRKVETFWQSDNTIKSITNTTFVDNATCVWSGDGSGLTIGTTSGLSTTITASANTSADDKTWMLHVVASSTLSDATASADVAVTQTTKVIVSYGAITEKKTYTNPTVSAAGGTTTCSETYKQVVNWSDGSTTSVDIPSSQVQWTQHTFASLGKTTTSTFTTVSKGITARVTGFAVSGNPTTTSFYYTAYQDKNELSETWTNMRDVSYEDNPIILPASGGVASIDRSKVFVEQNKTRTWTSGSIEYLHVDISAEATLTITPETITAQATTSTTETTLGKIAVKATGYNGQRGTVQVVVKQAANTTEEVYFIQAYADGNLTWDATNVPFKYIAYKITKMNGAYQSIGSVTDSVTATFSGSATGTATSTNGTVNKAIAKNTDTTSKTYTATFAFTTTHAMASESDVAAAKAATGVNYVIDTTQTFTQAATVLQNVYFIQAYADGNLTWDATNVPFTYTAYKITKRNGVVDSISQSSDSVTATFSGDISGTSNSTNGTVNKSISANTASSSKTYTATFDFTTTHIIAKDVEIAAINDKLGVDTYYADYEQTFVQTRDESKVTYKYDFAFTDNTDNLQIPYSQTTLNLSFVMTRYEFFNGVATGVSETGYWCNSESDYPFGNHNLSLTWIIDDEQTGMESTFFGNLEDEEPTPVDEVNYIMSYPIGQEFAGGVDGAIQIIIYDAMHPNYDTENQIVEVTFTQLPSTDIQDLDYYVIDADADKTIDPSATNAPFSYKVYKATKSGMEGAYAQYNGFYNVVDVTSSVTVNVNFSGDISGTATSTNGIVNKTIFENATQNSKTYTAIFSLEGGLLTASANDIQYINLWDDNHTNQFPTIELDNSQTIIQYAEVLSYFVTMDKDKSVPYDTTSLTFTGHVYQMTKIGGQVVNVADVTTTFASSGVVTSDDFNITGSTGSIRLLNGQATWNQLNVNDTPNDRVFTASLMIGTVVDWSTEEDVNEANNLLGTNYQIRGTMTITQLANVTWKYGISSYISVGTPLLNSFDANDEYATYNVIMFRQKYVNGVQVAGGFEQGVWYTHLTFGGDGHVFLLDNEAKTISFYIGKNTTGSERYFSFDIYIGDAENPDNIMAPGSQTVTINARQLS